MKLLYFHLRIVVSVINKEKLLGSGRLQRELRTVLSENIELL